MLVNVIESMKLHSTLDYVFTCDTKNMEKQ